MPGCATGQQGTSVRGSGQPSAAGKTCCVRAGCRLVLGSSMCHTVCRENTCEEVLREKTCAMAGGAAVCRRKAHPRG